MSRAGSPEPPEDRLDARLALPALLTWAGALVGSGSVVLGGTVVVVGAVGAVGALVASGGVSRVRGSCWTVVAAAVCLAAGAGTATLRLVALERGPVGDLARQGASVSVRGSMASDPRPGRSSAGPGPERRYVVLHLQVDEVVARGRATSVASPVLAIADESWSGLLPGTPVRASGRLAEPALGGPVAAVLRVRGPPTVLGEPGALARATEPFRAALREAVSTLPDGPRGLVPALVVGDESRLPPEVVADFATTGLTHLTAVSGANVAIVLAFLTGLARWAGVRGRLLPLVGAASVLAFVALARPEPSVLRAAAMGLVAVAGLSAGGRRRGVSALGTAVVVLLLVDPWLARTVGFALSVLATAAILLLAPSWRDALSRWLPRAAAEAVAVPLAAQVACTPVVAALSSAVSLSALPANLLAAPAVAPATVLGLVAALAGPVATAPAAVAGRLAGLPATWIVAVAERGAALPGAALAWSAAPAALALLAALCLLTLAVAPRLLSRPVLCSLTAAALVVVLLRPLPDVGWPPPSWVLVACDVGQGDAIAVRTGPRSAVVVDAGPDPAAVGRCLDGLGVRHVPAVVLTHFHADHVDGLPGVLRGRTVDRVLVGPLDDPPDQAAGVRREAGAAGVPVELVHAGERRTVGPLTWDVLWPRRLPTAGSRPNNASLVLSVRTAGVTALLTGDVEPEAQQALLAAAPALRADVLKVAHHGSADQVPEFVRATGARLALVSCGVDNDYGHPAPSALALLRATGALVARTDLDGDLAVTASPDGGLGLVRRGRSAAAAPARAGSDPAGILLP